MKEKHLTFREAFQRNEDFVAFVLRHEEFPEAKHTLEAGPHPSDEMLYDYVSEALSEAEASIVSEHLYYCGVCAEEVSRIRQFEKDVNAALWKQVNRLLPEPGIAEHIATEFWEPQYAGQPATANDIPQQQHTFFIEDGNITVECSWGAQSDSDPAYIRLSWKARINTEQMLSARFVDPETHETRSEACLGTALSGRTTFTHTDLGFDPSCERWAVSIVLQKS